MFKFLFLFLILQAFLFAFELWRPIQEAIILPWTALLASMATWLVSFFDADVIATGKVIRSTVNHFAVSIEPGCNGVEAVIVLMAAILAFPAPWLYKLKGLIIGFIAIQGLNLLRVISLFYLGQWSITLFDWAHLYVWQALIMLDALVVFLLWVRWLPMQKKPPKLDENNDTKPTDLHDALEKA